MGNRKSLPQHGMPNPALSLMLNNFTEKNLRRPLAWDNGNAASVHAKIFRPLSRNDAVERIFWVYFCAHA
jgi:hypothetical protein